MKLNRKDNLEFETLKKSHRKKIILGGLVVLGIVSSLTFTTSRARYKLTESIPLVSGTINYKPYDFKVMAMYQSDDGINYTEINEMPSEGYTVNEEKTYCTTDNKIQVKGKIKTINGNITISNLTKSDKCYIWFDKKIPTSEDTLAKLNITPNNGTPDFSQVATTDEGVYSVEDGMYGGNSYYWRGAVTNNYVKFANFCWRIVRINGDGSIRLIYDGSTCHANGTSTADSLAVTNQAYNSSYNKSNYVGWTYEGQLQRPSNNTTATASNAKTQVESWFNSNITGTNVLKLVEGKFCNDRNIALGYTWSINPSKEFYYASYDRSGGKSESSVIPTLSCSIADVYTLKVGAITIDEVLMAGGRWKISNTLYYLYNGQHYWAMSPIHWNGNYTGVSSIYADGSLFYNWTYSTLGIRPVINLRSDTTFSSGDGTLNSPYVVS